jgi:hypothetical protein
MSDDKTLLTQITEIVKLRQMSDDEWIELQGCSTVRRARRLGATWKDLYRKQRVCFEFGWHFEILPRSRVLFGDATSEGDCPAITEAQWLSERYILRRPFPEDYLEYKCIRITAQDDNAKIEREGFGLILRKTSATFIGAGNIVFCFVTEWDLVKKVWKEAVNPC